MLFTSSRPRPTLFALSSGFSALASYFELAFTFQLEYPVESAVTINLVQLKIVNYGNVDKGSLTKMAKTTVGNKIKRYDNEVDKE